jgi:C1q domain
MANFKITDLTAIPSVDRTANVLEIVDVAGNTNYKVTPNNLLGFTGGAPVSTTDTQTLTNKTLGNTNVLTLKDTLFTLQDDGDTTKQAQFQLSGISTATTRTYTLPNSTSTLVDLITAQTLTNKTLTSPVINTATISNPTLTVDTISGFTTSTIVSIAGLSISSGVLNSNNSVKTTNIQDAAVTSPKLQSTIMFRAYSTTAQNSGNAAFAKTSFQLEEYDIGNNFDSVTNFRFVAPQNGYYHFYAKAGTTSAGSRFLVSLFKNGSEHSRGSDVSTAAFTGAGVNVSAVIKLNTTDYVEVFTFGNAALALDSIQPNLYFGGYLIGS